MKSFIQHRTATCFALFALAIACTVYAQNPPTEEALSLRNLGLAQLENDKPEEAEATYRKLIRVASRDPLPHANLAVALIRQQESAAALKAIDKALELSPGRGDLLSIRGTVLAWSNSNDEALRSFTQAFAATPNHPKTAYLLFRHAGILRESNADAQAAYDEALAQMVGLRPDNLTILIEQGQRSIERGDRAAASLAYLRIRELVWAIEPRNRQLAERVLPRVLTALENNEVEKARVPALQLGNVLRASGRYRSSLVEFFDEIIGYPVERFAGETAPTPFGRGIEIAFSGSILSSLPGTGALAVADWNEDERADVAWGRTEGKVEVRTSGTDPIGFDAMATGLVLADLDNDVQLDLLVMEAGSTLLAAGADGAFSAPTAAVSDIFPAAIDLDVLDFDSDGDLDLVSATAVENGFAIDLHRNDGTGQLSSVGGNALPTLDLTTFSKILTGDLDRDGDHDLLVINKEGVRWVDNLRQGAYRDLTRTAGLARAPGATAAAIGDLDNDGTVDVLLAGTTGSERKVIAYQSKGGVLRAGPSFEAKGDIKEALLFDADNDGLFDIALLSSEGVEVFLRRGTRYQALTGLEKPDSKLRDFAGIAADDADGDGDLDLFAAGPSGLYLYTNNGGNKNGHMRISLRGLAQSTGSDKNNSFGIGSSVEVISSGGRQYREARGQVTHIGLGSVQEPDLLRVVWANGVPQNRIAPEPKQLIVEEQVLKGSCPFLYTWTGNDSGSGIEFVTDLLWGAPIGMPVAEGIYAEADPHELVVVQGAVPRNGHYDLRITEELWEAAYFDQTRLWIVDHPIGTEATGSLRVFPGPAPPKAEWPDRVLIAADLEAVTAWDGDGVEVTEQVAVRDHVYADGYQLGAYQGISDPWTFTFDLGQAPAAPIRLLLDGWIFPSDASINIAASQRTDIDFTFTRLEALTSDGWQTLIDPMGFPAGKTKTTVVDTPALPAGVSKLRIVTSRWLHWDRIAWSAVMPDEQAKVIAQLDPSSAELSYRGFSRMVRRAPNAPHEYNYDQLQSGSPWIPFPGAYTRYGDVREQLLTVDGGLVVMAAGDELRLLFDATDLPPVARGHKRTLFLESYGWDKDADRNTLDADTAWPLPAGTVQGNGAKTEPLLTRKITADSR